MSEPLTLTEQAAVRQLREHYQEHRSPADCSMCELWIAYTKQDLKTIDEIIRRVPWGEEKLVDDFRDYRSEWGEGEWTARDVLADEARRRYPW